MTTRTDTEKVQVAAMTLFRGEGPARACSTSRVLEGDNPREEARRQPLKAPATTSQR